MRVIIDIPEEKYDEYKEYVERHVASFAETIIADGTPIQTVTNAEDAGAYPIAENIPNKKGEEE